MLEKAFICHLTRVFGFIFCFCVKYLYQGFCTKFGGFGILWFYSHKIIAKMESYAMPKDEIYLGDLSWIVCGF